MSNDLIERLGEVGDLNDTWGESNLPERSPLYVVETLPRPPRRSRLVASGAVAAMALVAVVATSLIASGDRGVAPDPHPPTGVEVGTTVAERLSGDIPDGTSWTVDVPADSDEVCFQLASSSGCGTAPRAALIGRGNGYAILFGLLDAGLVVDGIGHPDGELVARSVAGVDVELTNGTIVTVDQVGQRLWVTLLPRGVTTWATITYHWDDGSSTPMSAEELAKILEVETPDRVEHLTEERQAGEAEARREAERQRELAEDRLRD